MLACFGRTKQKNNKEENIEEDEEYLKLQDQLRR